MASRGIRNNNPLNLRRNDRNAWLGKIYITGDKDFEVFSAMVYGIRAAMVNVRTLCRRHLGLTVQGLIKIWAPAEDGNNPKRYIQLVCTRSGLMPTQRVDYRSRELMCNLLYEMTFVENGEYVDRQIFYDAFDML